MGFSIQTPTQILFGRGMKDRAAEAIAAFGPRGVLVHGANPARAEWLLQALRAKGCTLMTLPVRLSHFHGAHCPEPVRL